MSSKDVRRAVVAKKRVMISYGNLTPELLELLRERYPDGFTDHMTRVDKPTGGSFFGVVLETSDTNYFVKITVKIDNKTQDDIEKELFAEAVLDSIDIKDVEEIADTSESDDD